VVFAPDACGHFALIARAQSSVLGELPSCPSRSPSSSLNFTVGTIVARFFFRGCISKPNLNPAAHAHATWKCLVQSLHLTHAPVSLPLHTQQVFFQATNKSISTHDKEVQKIINCQTDLVPARFWNRWQSFGNAQQWRIAETNFRMPHSAKGMHMTFPIQRRRQRILLEQIIPSSSHP
jgi:hypothetical protein